jgi:hypothetical protein
MTDKICPCEPLPAKLAIYNSAAQDTIGYRVGDFNSFRRALLLALPNERQLGSWRPGANTDLALQMIEWWAYLGDILTFYNERIANQDYLRTADLPESVRRLVELLGYRPRPGIGAIGTLAALVSGNKTITIPRGFSVDSKPGPGQDPQTFELDKDTIIVPGGSVPATPPQYLLSPATDHFLIAGTSKQVKAGDSLVLVSANPSSQTVTPVLLTVTAVDVTTNPDKTKQTRVSFTAAGALPDPLPAKSLEVQRSSESIGLWTANGAPIWGNDVHLAAVARSIHPGDLVVFTAPSGTLILATVSEAIDVLWYLNPDGADPSIAPKPPTVPIGVLHTRISVSRSPLSSDGITVLFGWRDIGPLIDQPAVSFDGSSPTLLAVEPAQFPSGNAIPILIEGGLGAGESATGAVSGDNTTLTVSGLPVPAPSLPTLLKVLYNLLPVSRGKTVGSEILGSGNAAIAGQEFVLQKSPVTYFAKGTGFVSTIAVRVNGRLWSEAASFYDQAPDAEIFVTSEDDQQKTHIKFGDGINGARLPTGSNNVVATYRYGSGASSPGPGELTVISKPFPGVSSVRNPAPVGGGADPDPPGQIRKYAPRSVLTFGRAVSADDYEVIAVQAPGVTRARSYWSWNADEQRAVVTVYVGDDQAALTSAKSALAASGDPNRQVAVVAATPVQVVLLLLILVDPKYVPSDVADSVKSGLLDAGSGLFGQGRPGIGEAVFHSQIAAACVGVEGAVSLRASLFISFGQSGGQLEYFPRHDPGEGAYYEIKPDWVLVFTEVDSHAG